MATKNKKWKSLYIILVAIIAFVPRIIMAWQAYPLRTPSDELSTICGAAILSGNDWREVISHAGYYGPGFYSLCAPFFKIFHDPVIIYRAILTVATIAQASTALICFYICDHYANLEDNYFLISLISIISNYAVMTRTTIAYNEHPLILISWIMVLLLCKYFEKEKIWYALWIYLLLGYSLIVHTRAMMLLIAISAILLGIEFRYKRMKRCTIHFIGITGAYFFSNVICKLYRQYIWDTADGVRNSEYSTKLSKFSFDLESFQAWLNIVLGQIQTINFILCGGVIISIVAIIVLLIYKKNENEIVLWIFGFAFLCIGGTIFAQSLKWFDGAKTAIESHYIFAYSCKAFTYVRYFGPYVGMAIMCGLIAIYKSCQKRRLIIGISSVISILLLRFWAFSVYEFVRYNVNAVEVFWPFGKIVEKNDVFLGRVDEAVFIFVVLILIFLGFLLLKKDKIAYGVLLAALMYQYITLASCYDIGNQKMQLDKIADTVAVLQNSQVDMMYVYDGSGEKDHQTYYLYQMYFYDAKIIPGLPEQSYKGILCSNVRVDDQLEGYCYDIQQLGEGQYLYTFK